MEQIKFSRTPKSWLERSIWDSPVWDTYVRLGGDQKEVWFDPSYMTIAEVQVHYKFIRSVESQFEKVYEDWFILAAIQKPSLFTNILSRVICFRRHEQLDHWLLRHASPAELAEGYRIFRNSVYEIMNSFPGLKQNES